MSTHATIQVVFSVSETSGHLATHVPATAKVGEPC
jgi:hypothetical protein